MIDGIAGVLLLCGLTSLISVISSKAAAAMKQKIQGTTEYPAAERQPDIQAMVTEQVENQDGDSAFMKLAELCKMGDIIAMLDMAYYFKDRCEEPLRNLLDAYEQQSIKENEDNLIKYMIGRSRSEIGAYTMWLVRAAIYGNEQAQQLIEKCPYYKKVAYIPYTMLTGEGSSFIKFWNSDSLWEMGLIDMERGCTDCSFTFNQNRGYFIFSYVSDYIPYDEDGFGAEWDYEDVYYDEFFCRISGKSKEEISRELLTLEKEREAYWQLPAHDAPNRKYHRRLCNEE